jgi:hypothetical protein
MRVSQPSVSNAMADKMFPPIFPSRQPEPSSHRLLVYLLRVNLTCFSVRSQPRQHAVPSDKQKPMT